MDRICCGMSEEEVLCSALPGGAEFDEAVQIFQEQIHFIWNDHFYLCPCEQRVKCDILVPPSGRISVEYLTFLFFPPLQTLVPPLTPPLPVVIALIGAALPTGSSAHVWVDCIQPSSLRSTFSTTYLKARASVSASSTPMPTILAATAQEATDTTATPVEGIAAAACNKFAVKSAMASC